jgi:hypothetical protein
LLTGDFFTKGALSQVTRELDNNVRITLGTKLIPVVFSGAAMVGMITNDDLIGNSILKLRTVHEDLLHSLQPATTATAML